MKASATNLEDDPILQVDKDVLPQYDSRRQSIKAYWDNVNDKRNDPPACMVSTLRPDNFGEPNAMQDNEHKVYSRR